MGKMPMPRGATMARFQRIKQPPIDRMGRPSESRTKWWGLGLAVAGVAILVAGFHFKHYVADTTQGTYHENWLIQSVLAPRAHQIYPAPAGQAEKPAGKAAEPDVCVT
jgi:hypothetical protein